MDLFVILTLAFLSSFYLVNILKSSEYFNENIFIAGNVLLYLFGFSIFLKLYKNYESRELVKSNINTIVLQSLFSIFYILVLNLFFI